MTTISASSPTMGVKGLGGRWFRFTFAAVAGGELLFAVVSGALDEAGIVGQIGGHVPTLIALGAIISCAQQRALGLDVSVRPALACGLATWLSYVLGFVLLGPPMDFLLSLIVTGFVSAYVLSRRLRGRGVSRSACIGGIGAAFVGGGVLGVAAAVVFGSAVDATFGSGVPGFTAVVSMIGVVAGTVAAALSMVPVTRMMRVTSPV